VDAGVPSDQMPFTESLIADLLVTYAFDLPDTFVMATQRHLAELGIDSSSIRNLAIENLKQNMPQIALQKSGAVFRAVTGNNLDACTLLSRNLWSNQAKQMKGDLIASAPTRDIVLFCDSASEDGLREMKRLVQQAFNAGGNHALTQALLRWSENGWQHYQA
jgi:uncharacterized protein YtpQ (UPF0354 family)